jgi:ketosteroid isomerase-like protein
MIGQGILDEADDMVRMPWSATRFMNVCVLLIAGAALLAGCTSEPWPEASSSALLEADRAFAARSVAASPADAFAEFLEEEALQLPHGALPIQGRDSIVASMRAGPAFSLDWEPKHAEVSVSGDLGWTWGTYVATFQDSAGAKIESAGKYLNVWRRQPDGSWKVAVDMGNQH